MGQTMSQPWGQARNPAADTPSLASPRDGAMLEELLRLLAGSRKGDLLLLAAGNLAELGRAASRHRQDQGYPEVVCYAPGQNGAVGNQDCLSCGMPGLARGPDELAEMLAGHLVYEPTARISLFPPFNLADSRQIPQLRQARAALDQALSRAKVNTDTQTAHWRMWLDNLAVNFPSAFREPDVTTLKGVFAGLPALVLGAGPSLDQSLGLLPKAAAKCLMLGAASVFSPLESVGVRPHLAVALEGKDESRQFLGADPGKTLLAAASSSHFNHFRRWPGRPSVFHMQPWAAGLAGQGLVLPTGGHATSAAFSLAVLWGCNPIVLAGQDLAYPGGRVHASGRPGGEDYKLPELNPVPALNGGVAQTSAVMESYLHWYRESASYLKKADPGRSLINATAEGALIAGFEHRNLAEILDSLPDLPGEVNLASLCHRLPVARDATLSQGLAKEITSARRTALAMKNGDLSAGLPMAGKDSAAAWALQSMPQNADNETRRSGMDYLLESLLRMREALHGPA